MGPLVRFCRVGLCSLDMRGNNRQGWMEFDLERPDNLVGVEVLLRSNGNQSGKVGHAINDLMEFCGCVQTQKNKNGTFDPRVFLWTKGALRAAWLQRSLL